MRIRCGTILAAAVVAGRLALPAAADEWKEIPLDSCRKVPGLSENMMGLSLGGKTLYAIGGGTLYALDVSEPANPRRLGNLDGMDNNRQIAVSDGFAYVVSRETGMRIVDVSDPKNMRLRSLYDSVEFATGIDVVGKTVFLSERIYGVEAVDVSDPDRPRHLAMRKTDESQSNRYRDGYLYSGEWGSGTVTVFDAHDMRAFRAIGKVDLGGFGDGVEIAGRYLYCSGRWANRLPARDADSTSSTSQIRRSPGLSRVWTFPCSRRATKISGQFARRTDSPSAAIATMAYSS